MLLISHRGNLDQKHPETENTVYAINRALDLGLDVEIDIWYIENSFWLGHDTHIYPINEEYLENPHLWCHAKNIQALQKMLENPNIHCFWHQEDQYSITSRGMLWTYPGCILTNRSICVLPELTMNYTQQDIKKCYGICSDIILKYL